MSIIPGVPSFLDDVKEKGVKKAVLEGVDEVVERLTAGMNVQDIREALRGEPASRRPNPRLQPHSDGFWLHMRPGYFHADMTGVYPTFRLGWLSTYFVIFETITGLLMMLWYTPSPEIAYSNMLEILNNVPLGQLTRDLHRLGAEAMVIIVALHMMRTWVTGSFKKPRQFTWFTGLLLLVFTGLLSFTGYLLPWDQLALWAVTIGASMVEASPIAGAELNLLVRGAPELGANGLLRFYLAHVLLLPLLLFVFTFVHYYKVIIHGHSLPPKSENIGEDTAKRVPLDKRVYYIPDILTNELMWIGVTTFVMVVLCIWFYHAPLENHADPQNTPLGTTAPWYFLWVQGTLKLGDKFFWGIFFPTVLLGVLALMPYIDVTPSRRFAHRRISLTLAMALVSFMTVLSYMGLPEFAVSTTAENEILHELTKEPAHNHVGIMRTVPFEQLQQGAYTIAQFEGDDPTAAVKALNEELQEHQIFDVTAAPAPGGFTTEFAFLIKQIQGTDHLDVNKLPTNFRVTNDPSMVNVLREFEEHIHDRSTELRNARGFIIVNDYQTELKRVDLVIIWDGVEIEDGLVKMDATGNSIPLLIRDADGNPLRYKVDAEGHYELDEAGQAILDPNGQTVQETRIFARHIYIHADSAYFD